MGEDSTGHSRLILCNKEKFLTKELWRYSSPLVIALVDFSNFGYEQCKVFQEKIVCIFTQCLLGINNNFLFLNIQ